jgi:DNA mismatch repair protein MutL
VLACATVAVRIRILDDALADQIAAGEVVERPASVVKELLENAIDAGATRVRVEIEDGGCGRIRVVDDGNGMSPPDAVLSLRRHATSKLTTFSDLQALRTLGFRGEALPSIASVSRFSLVTREASALGGVRVEVDGGSEPKLSEIGAPAGTTVEVRDLFFNVPARLKFLKARPTESGHVAAVCTRAALAYPALALALSSDGRVTRDFRAAGSFAERARAVFPEESLATFAATRDELHVEAALAAPERARMGASGLQLFVNGRPVRDQALARAVAFAYGSVMPPGRYPVGALHVTLPPDAVDVNVHPQKLEVRFADSRGVLDAITRLLAKQLGTTAFGGPMKRSASYWDARLSSFAGREPAAGTGSGAGTGAGSGAATERGFETRPYGEESGEAGADPWGLRSSAVGDGLGVAEGPSVEQTAVPAGEEQGVLMPRGFFGSLRVLGQVRRMLLVCEGQDALYVLDQHAVDERVRFDRLRRSYQARAVETQRLLFPERVTCNEIEVALVESQAEALSGVGLECSVLGPATVAVHTVPALLPRAAPERLLRDLLGELERAGGRGFSAAIERALATMACHGAIRAGDALSIEQAEALLRNLDEIEDFAGHCPHGRPVVQSISLAAIEHRLGR